MSRLLLLCPSVAKGKLAFGIVLYSRLAGLVTKLNILGSRPSPPSLMPPPPHSQNVLFLGDLHLAVPCPEALKALCLPLFNAVQ